MCQLHEELWGSFRVPALRSSPAGKMQVKETTCEALVVAGHLRSIGFMFCREPFRLATDRPLVLKGSRWLPTCCTKISAATDLQSSTPMWELKQVETRLLYLIAPETLLQESELVSTEILCVPAAKRFKTCTQGNLELSNVQHRRHVPFHNIS